MVESATLAARSRPTKEERIRRNQAAVEALRSFREGDEAEQRETLEALQRGLGEERSSYRKLFAKG